MTMTPQKKSFPDYDNQKAFDACLEALKPLGFEDSTYQHDACPSMVLMTRDSTTVRVALYVDYKNPLGREMPEQSEFAVCIYTGAEHHIEKWSSFWSATEALNAIITHLQPTA